MFRRSARGRSFPSVPSSAASAMFALALFGCDLGSGPPPQPASVIIADGEGQSATVGTPVQIPPAVQVLSKKGKPIKGREVSFSVVSGGGYVSLGVQTTDKEGIARVGTWVLGPVAGSNLVQALVPGLPPVTFSATGEPGPPARLGVQAGNGQTGVVGEAVGEPPSVWVNDSHGNPVPGVAVGFSVGSGGGYVVGAPAQTNGSGIARVGDWFLGTAPGLNTLVASVPGLAPVTFTSTAMADVPASVTVLLGDGQTGRVGELLPLLPTVLVADRYGNLLEGVAATFQVETGGGSVTNGVQATNSQGVAVSGGWTLGPTAGPQTLSVAVTGLTPSVLTATAEPGPPAAVLAWAGTSQTATVGSSVPEPPSVRLEDAFGNPVPGVQVTFMESSVPSVAQRVPVRTGVLTGEETETDAEGLASLGSWVLGTTAGEYEVTAVAAGLEDAPVRFHASALPDRPAVLRKVSGDDQVALFGAPVEVPPSVRVEDQFGNGVPGEEVAFTVVEGGGSVAPGTAMSDVDGLAVVDSWVLGPMPGNNVLRATLAEVGQVAFHATSLTGEPDRVLAVAGTDQTAVVGTPVAVLPRVKVVDGNGSGVAFVPVVFSVVAGGGEVTGGTVLTDMDGEAQAGSWTLGTVVGENRLSAEVEGLTPALFHAMATPGAPAFMQAASAVDQTAQVGAAVPFNPAVRLWDTYGNLVPGVVVSFTPVQGGGLVSGTPATSNSSGIASVTSWVLGPSPGLNLLRASAPGVPSVEFSATATAEPPVASYDVEVEFLTGISASQAAIFQQAAARWQEIIIGDVPDLSAPLNAGGCQPVAEPDGVDDIIIYVSVGEIDGAGGILGQAGPCLYRLGTRFPATGVMELDVADVANMEANGLLLDVIIHEMGHVLGLGTMWSLSPSLLMDGGTDDPYFDGAAAIAAFDAAGGAGRTDPKVPVENTGGGGTRDAHWRESVHDSELMTGWIEPPGTANPLSAITVASFADMGYTVDPSAADPYVLPNPLAAARVDTGPKIFLKELAPPTPIPVGGAGR